MQGPRNITPSSSAATPPPAPPSPPAPAAPPAPPADPAPPEVPAAPSPSGVPAAPAVPPAPPSPVTAPPAPVIPSPADPADPPPLPAWPPTGPLRPQDCRVRAIPANAKALRILSSYVRPGPRLNKPPRPTRGAPAFAQRFGERRQYRGMNPSAMPSAEELLTQAAWARRLAAH